MEVEKNRDSRGMSGKNRQTNKQKTAALAQEMKNQ